MKYEFFDREQLRQEGLAHAQIPEIFKRSVGEHHAERWVCTSPKFRPLRDMLALSREDNTVKFFDRLKRDAGVQQFILAPELAYEATKLARQVSEDPELVKRLMPKVMTPYPSVCVELPVTDQVRAIRASVLPGQLEVQRVGAYITTTDGGDAGLTYTFIPYYEFTNGCVCASPVVVMHNSNNSDYDSGEMPIGLAMKMLNYDMVWIATFHPHDWSTLSGRNIPVDRVWKTFSSADFKGAAAETVDEVPVLFFAWLVLVNSKSGITPTKVAGKLPPPRLGKRQQRERERSAYTVLCLSDLEQADPTGLVSSRAAASAHRVRGHFKARKRGVFWWRPHVRGVGDIIERGAYKVQSVRDTAN